MKTSAIAPSMNASLTRSVVESMKAPNGVALPPTRASAPSRMSSTEPITKTTRAEPEEEQLVAVLEVDEHAAGDAERARRPAVSMFGVTRVRARPCIERAASRSRPRACTLSLSAACSNVSALGGPAGARDDPTPARARRRPPATSTPTRDVEPEVVAGRHHGEPDPRRPEQPERSSPSACGRRAPCTSPTISASSGVEARHRRVRVRRELRRGRCRG